MAKDLATTETKEITTKEGLLAMFSQLDGMDFVQQEVEQIAGETKSYRLAPPLQLEDAKSNSNPGFNINKGALDKANILVGTIVSYIPVNEYREDPSKPIPDCMSIGAKFGTVCHACNPQECDHAKWVDGHRECDGSYRVVVSIYGEGIMNKKTGAIEKIERTDEFKDTPYEIKVSKASVSNFRDLLKEIADIKPTSGKLNRKGIPQDVLVSMRAVAKKAAFTYSELQWNIEDILRDRCMEDPEDKEFIQFVQRTISWAASDKFRYEPTPENPAAKLLTHQVEDAIVTQASPAPATKQVEAVISQADEDDTEEVPF